MKAQILVVEDDRPTSETIELYLRNDGFAVTTAHDGLRGLELARSGDFQLLILDLMLPKLSGSEVCRSVRKNSNLPIIMLTARTTEDDRIQGLELGADDYVSKPFSPRELVVRVRAVLRRSEHPELGGRERLHFDGLTIDLARSEVHNGEGPIELTRAEFNILTTMARAPGRLFSRETLAERALGDSFSGLDRTVDVHIKNLRKKIEPDRSQPIFVETVFGQGYRFAGRRR